jgi:hypothetical protein
LADANVKLSDDNPTRVINMTQKTHRRVPALRSVFPDRLPLSQEEIAKRKAEQDARYQLYRAVFERVRPELIENHYNWFVVIEPNSGDYFIDADEQLAIQKARQRYPSGRLGILRLNETGSCGRI